MTQQTAEALQVAQEIANLSVRAYRGDITLQERDCEAVMLISSMSASVLVDREAAPVGWIRGSGLQMLRDGHYACVYAHEGDSNHSTPVYLAAQPAPGKVTVTTDEAGECVAVTRTDDSHRILDVLWKRNSLSTPAPVQADKPAQDRGAFEVFFRHSRASKGKSRLAGMFNQMPDGTYAADYVQRHWWTWQQSRSTLGAQASASPESVSLDLDANPNFTTCFRGDAA